MYGDDFEKAFSDFLERKEYDQAENALFEMVRISFIAGWRSAGGDPPPPQRVLQILHRKDIDPNCIESELCAPSKGEDEKQDE